MKVDLIEHSCLCLGAFNKITNKYCFEFGLSLIDFMVEVIQGPCRENQVCMLTNNVVAFCKDLTNEIVLIKDYKV